MTSPRSLLLSLFPTATGMAIALTACSDAPLREATDSTGSPIEIGADDTSSPTRDAVMKLRNGSGLCTATLVAGDKVITAAHCMDPSQITYDGTWHLYNGLPFFANFGRLFGTDTLSARADYVNLPPTQSSGGFANDIALLTLDDMVPSDIAIPRQVSNARPPTLSSTSSLFEMGYGAARDRRIMTASNYHDWNDSSVPQPAFTYTPTFTGAGIGDRNTNIEGGDSGGPIFFGTQTGPLIGVLSWWDPIGISTFAPLNTNWVSDAIGEGPDSAWVWANQTTGTYTAEPLYSSNPHGAPTISYIGVGGYMVTFPAAGRADGGSVQVVAYGSDDAYCKVSYSSRVNDTLHVSVLCFDHAGNGVPSKFVLTYVRRHKLDGANAAYVRTSGNGTAVAKQWNTTGARTSIAHPSLGRYTVTFPGMSSSRTTAAVTALGSNNVRCKVTSWGGAAVNVRCDSPTGGLADSDFDLSYSAARTVHDGPGGHAWISDTTSSTSTPSASFQFMSNGTTVSAGTNANGTQWVTFPGLWAGPASMRVTAYGDNPNYCKVQSWGAGATVTTRCYTPAGVLTPSQYSISYLNR